jgi:hypothetical protein
MIAYKLRPFDQLDRIADILVAERLYCPLYYDLNDPFEGVCTVYGHFDFDGKRGRRYFSHTAIDDIVDPEDFEEIRVCSLSGSVHDVRQWSHYGGGHKGVAIEIDFSGFPESIHKITYNDGLRKYDESLGEHPSVTSILTNKTRHWEYEDEYRVFSTKSFVSIAGRIRRVLLGPRCYDEEEAIVRRLVPSGVTVVRTKLDHGTTTVRLKKPNKAPEPTTMAVTIHAPSSTARASHGRGSS